jgi:N-acetylglucosamine-6-sulfatase
MIEGTAGWMMCATHWRGVLTAGGLVLLAAAALMIIMQTGQPTLGVERASAATTRPNIVLVVTDDQRWDSLWAQPNVQSMVVSHGTNFRQGFVENPLCCPSRVTILTGKYSHTTGVWGNGGGFAKFKSSGLDKSTVATWLKAAGYRTGLFGKYLNGYCPANASYIPPGWSRWLAFDGPSNACGQGSYYGFTVSDQGVNKTLPTSVYSTDYLASRAVNFINGTSATQPLFLMLSTKAPHSPSTPPTRYATRFSTLAPYDPASFNEADVSDKPGWVRSIAPWTSAQISNKQKSIKNIYRTLLGVDDAVHRIADTLQDTGRLQNTLFIYMSDNGEQWGEHRLGGKNDPYLEGIRIPLVIRYDPAGSTARIDTTHIAMNVDIAQTIAAAAGVSAPGAEGRSLLPLLSGTPPSWRSDALAEHIAAAGGLSPTFCEVHSLGWAYTQYSTGEEELYDLNADPLELQNRAKDPAFSATLTTERNRLHQLCQPTPPGFTFSH